MLLFNKLNSGQFLKSIIISFLSWLQFMDFGGITIQISDLKKVLWWQHSWHPPLIIILNCPVLSSMMCSECSVGVCRLRSAYPCADRSNNPGFVWSPCVAQEELQQGLGVSIKVTVIGEHIQEPLIFTCDGKTASLYAQINVIVMFSSFFDQCIYTHFKRIKPVSNLINMLGCRCIAAFCLIIFFNVLCME